MKLNEDLGDLTPRGKATLFGALALCCVVPMLVVFGALSVAGAFFGATAAIVVGAIAILGWGVWMSKHHGSMADHDDSHEKAPDHEHAN